MSACEVTISDIIGSPPGVVPEQLVSHLLTDDSKSQYLIFNFHNEFGQDPANSHLLLIYKLGEFFACFVSVISLFEDSVIINELEQSLWHQSIGRFENEENMLKVVKFLRENNAFVEITARISDIATNIKTVS